MTSPYNNSFHVIDSNGDEIFIQQEDQPWNLQFCANVMDAHKQKTGLDSRVIVKPIFVQFPLGSKAN